MPTKMWNLGQSEVACAAMPFDSDLKERGRCSVITWRPNLLVKLLVAIERFHARSRSKCSSIVNVHLFFL